MTKVRTMTRTNLHNLTEEAILKALGGQLEVWAHRCHEASLQLVRSKVLGKGARVARGWCSGVGSQHSWAVVGNPYDTGALVVDPTLWSYKSWLPRVWYGTLAVGLHHPHGEGSIWEAGRPPHAVKSLAVELRPKRRLSKKAREFLDIIGPLDKLGWGVLAGGPVGGWPAAEIIAAMDDTPELRALVSIDRLGMLTDRNPGGLYL